MAVPGRLLLFGLSPLLADERFWETFAKRGVLFTLLPALLPCPAAILVLLLRRLGDPGAWSDVDLNSEASEWDVSESDSGGLSKTRRPLPRGVESGGALEQVPAREAPAVD